MARRVRHSLSGFGLIELLVVLAVAAILATLAIPSMRDTIAQRELRNAEQTLAGLIRKTRTEARQRGTPITLRLQSSSATVTIQSADGSFLHTERLQGVTAAQTRQVTFLPTGIVTGDTLLPLRSSRPGGPTSQLEIVSAVGQVRIP